MKYILMGLCNSAFRAAPSATFRCEYTNWRGEKSERRFRPQRLWIGATEYHPEPGVILTAYDLDKCAARDFRFADFDMRTWQVDAATS